MKYVMHAYVGGERKENLETLTPAMWECLYHACWKNSKRGGKATVAALEARGLLKNGKITTEGLAAQLVVWRHPFETAPTQSAPIP